jgi:hypothetical protein
MFLRKKALLLVSVVLVAVSSCGSSDDVTDAGKGKEKIEGWAGSPDSPGKKPYDYFYMKKSARASQKAVDKKSGAMMKETCTDAATTSAKGDLIGKMVGESVQGASGVSDGESTGKVVVREFNAKVQGVNTKECKPLMPQDPQIPYAEWKECECVIFVKIDGGREAIVARAKEIENK